MSCTAAGTGAEQSSKLQPCSKYELPSVCSCATRTTSRKPSTATVTARCLVQSQGCAVLARL